jgi:predicted nucleic-acid-binding protein
MIAVDTNALVRMLIEDDAAQAKAVQKVLIFCEIRSIPVLVLTEVLIETVWVLESVYNCNRQEISQFLETLTHTAALTFADSQILRKVIAAYKKEGDFADLVIVHQAKSRKAIRLFSFDNKLKKAFPGFLVETLNESDYPAPLSEK